MTSTDDLLAGTRLEHPCGLVVTTHATREASARNETARTGAAIVRREISAPVATSITVPYRLTPRRKTTSVCTEVDGADCASVP